MSPSRIILEPPARTSDTDDRTEGLLDTDAIPCGEDEDEEDPDEGSLQPATVQISGQ